ncbi:hypothetical protein KNE206_10440 [Kitasatospora sp. NE20-6]
MRPDGTAPGRTARKGTARARGGAEEQGVHETPGLRTGGSPAPDRADRRAGYDTGTDGRFRTAGPVRAPHASKVYTNFRETLVNTPVRLVSCVLGHTGQSLRTGSPGTSESMRSAR